jgi:hypothetical protein
LKDDLNETPGREWNGDFRRLVFMASVLSFGG